jgi:hypothetical protein
MRHGGSPCVLKVRPVRATLFENQERFRAHCAGVIHPRSNATQTRWDHGDCKVQLNQ